MNERSEKILIGSRGQLVIANYTGRCICLNDCSKDIKVKLQLCNANVLTNTFFRVRYQYLCYCKALSVPSIIKLSLP